MPKIIANGLETHYMQMGRGTENLIMLHGLSGNLAVWHLRMVGRLQKDFRIVTYDLRGHGYTEMPPTGYTTKHLAEDLRGLLDALEIERTSLVGHSFGSDVALHFALLYPERVNKIIAMEPGLAAMVHVRNREDWEGWRYWREALGEFGREVPKEHYFNIIHELLICNDSHVVTGVFHSHYATRYPVADVLGGHIIQLRHFLNGVFGLNTLGHRDGHFGTPR